MSIHRALIPTALALGGGLLAAGPAQAAAQPYSPAGVCGAGFGVIDQRAAGPSATAYLLYQRSTGRNCAVTLKTRYVGKVTSVTSQLQRRGGALKEDSGRYRYYAGPIYVKAPGVQVRFGGGSTDLAGDGGGDLSPWGHGG